MKKACSEKQIFGSAKPYATQIILSFLLLILSAALAFPIPILTKYLINSVIQQNNSSGWSFETYTILLLLALLIKELTISMSHYSFETITRKVSASIRKLLFETLQFHYENLPRKEIGRILTYITQDTEKLKSFMYPTFVNFFKDVLTIIFALLAGIYLNLTITLVSLIPLALFFLLIRFINPKIRRLSSNLLESQTEFISRLKEYIAGLEVFRIFLKEKFAVKKFSEVNEAYTRSDIQKIRAIVLYNFPLSILFHSGYIVALLAGAYLVKEGKMEIGTLFAILMIVGYIYDSSRNLWDFNVHREEIKVILARLGEILNLNCRNDEMPPSVGLKAVDRIDITIPEFYYLPDKPLIKNLNITAKKGEIIGITGKSGQGKSTLIRIMLGLIAKEKNFVRVNGVFLREIPLNEYYSKIGYLPQYNVIFKGTIRENIMLSDANLPEDPYLLDILSELPPDKPVEELGKNLSGGEIRRIMIARTFAIPSKNLYLLDEPFVHLDVKNIEKVKKLILSRTENSIIFVISHSVDILRGLCQRIIRLD